MPISGLIQTHIYKHTLLYLYMLMKYTWWQVQWNTIKLWHLFTNFSLFQHEGIDTVCPDISWNMLLNSMGVALIKLWIFKCALKQCPSPLSKYLVANVLFILIINVIIYNSCNYYFKQQTKKWPNLFEQIEWITIETSPLSFLITKPPSLATASVWERNWGIV